MNRLNTHRNNTNDPNIVATIIYIKLTSEEDEDDEAEIISKNIAYTDAQIVEFMLSIHNNLLNDGITIVEGIIVTIFIDTSGLMTYTYFIPSNTNTN